MAEVEPRLAQDLSLDDVMLKNSGKGSKCKPINLLHEPASYVNILMAADQRKSNADASRRCKHRITRIYIILNDGFKRFSPTFAQIRVFCSNFPSRYQIYGDQSLYESDASVLIVSYFSCVML